jgi:hypothetical protein
MVMVGDDGGNIARFTSPAASPMGGGRYSLISNSAVGNAQVDPGAASTKIYELLMNGVPATAFTFTLSGANSAATNRPTNTVSMIRPVNNPTRSSLVVDPLNNLVYIGEGEMFGSGSIVTGNQRIFLDNLMLYIGNAAKYGTHFTDLMLEPTWTLPAGVVVQPSPLDASYWGANAGVVR